MERAVAIEKLPGEPLGIELASPVFDRVRTCDNHCPFCFIYQLPKGMRRSLYVKDDDYRLSFLYGNFTTLTRFTEADLERVVTERLGPLYVSIHATDPKLRARLLRNPRGATSLRWLRALLDAGTEVHGQVVVCPGINDGAALDNTLLGVLDEYPRLASLGLVPLGVSDHTTEPDLRFHTTSEADAVLDMVKRWQERYVDALGRRLVFAADEYYLMAGRAFPGHEEYDGFPQQENGIGMARVFATEVTGALDGTPVATSTPHTGFFNWVDGAPSWGYRAPRALSVVDERDHTRPIAIITGEYGARVLDPLLADLARTTDAPLRLVTVANKFFGGNIAVTGLMTGNDVAAALQGQSPHDRYLLPDVALSNGRFLDGSDLTELPLPVEVVPTDGASLVAAVAAR
jgi:NifB/MoaA-like Fe-S oxidoreductase